MTNKDDEILNTNQYIKIIVESDKGEKIAEITPYEAIPADGYRIRLVPKCN